MDPDDPRAEDRDRFVLSKGHGPASLYAILAHKGFFPRGAKVLYAHLGGAPAINGYSYYYKD